VVLRQRQELFLLFVYFVAFATQTQEYAV